jgi:hypothetical protein
VYRVPPFGGTEFLFHDLIRLLLLVPERRVVDPGTVLTLEVNNVSHGRSLR